MAGKKYSRTICLIAVAVISLLAGQAIAQKAKTPDAVEPPAPKIAIVSVEIALREAKAVKSVRGQLNEISAKYKKEIDDEETALRAMDQELQQQRTILAPEVFAQRREDFQQKAAQLQQKARALRQAMDQGFKDTMQKIQDVLFEEVAKLAREKGFNLVLPSSQVIVSIESMDITRQAIERVDARLPDVKLTLTEKSAAGAPKAKQAPSGR